MSHLKNASSNRDALFGSAAGGGGSSSTGGPKIKRDAASNRDALFGNVASTKSSTSSSKTTGSSRPSTSTSTAAANTTSAKGYTPSNIKPTTSSKGGISLLSGEARAAKIKEAEEFRDKANKCMQSGFFQKSDPVAASTYFKRAADAYKQAGEERLERLYRLSSGECNMKIGAWGSAANDYERAAELLLDATDITDGSVRRRDAAAYYRRAGDAWTQLNEKAKAAGMLVKAAMALQYGDESRLLSKEALTGIEEAIEAHVPDPLNPYVRYRQTGHSSFIDVDSEETAINPSRETLELAKSHIVTRAYSHEPLQDLVYMLVGYGEYASALYAAGATTAILENENLSTLTLSRAYLVESILMLAMGDPIAAEETFLSKHVQKTFYLSTRECKLAEELFRAIKQRDIDALEETRSITGSNKTALSNLHESLRVLVTELRLSGVARKTIEETVKAPIKDNNSGDDKKKKKKSSSKSKDGSSSSSKSKTSTLSDQSLDDLLKQKTGYEKDLAAGKNLDPNALQNELDALDFDELGDDDDDRKGKKAGGFDELDELEDDDVDLR